MVDAFAINEAVITGSISSIGNLSGRMNGSTILRGAISIPTGYERYTGNYTVTPDIHGQTLATQNKYMSDDVSVNPIPYYEVSNAHGGITIIIGGCEHAT